MEFLPIKGFEDLTANEIMEHIRTFLEIDDNQEKRKFQYLSLPDIVIDFFKLKNISQKVAVENGILLYLYFILWKEQNPRQFSTLEEFFYCYAQRFHVVLK